MTTNVNMVYPPIVESSIPAFLYTSKNITINFSIPLTVNYNNVQHIDIRIVKQSNNKSIINTYDGLLYINKSDIKYDSLTGKHSVSINSNYIKVNDNPGWAENVFYKIQLRFGYGKLIPETEEEKQLIDYWWYEETDLDQQRIKFFKWKRAQTTMSNFSEWSNIIIAKSISKPIVEILNNQSQVDGFDIYSIYAENIEQSRFPQFQLGYSNSSEEPLDKYRLKLYKEDSVQESNLFLQTDWLQFNGSGNEKYSALIKYTFNQPLEHLKHQVYTLIFEIITKNQYQTTAEPYTFSITETYLKNLESLSFVVKDNSNNDFYVESFKPANKYVFNQYLKIFDDIANDSSYVRAYEEIILEDKDGNVLKDSSDNILTSIFEKQEDDFILQPGEILYKTSNGVYGILTEQQRINKAKSLQQDISADENGCLRIFIKNNPYYIESALYDSNNKFYDWEYTPVYQNLDGVYYLSRASEKTNYTIWEDIARFEWYNENNFNNELTLLYEDFTVESGIRYKYAFQKQNLSGLRSAPRYEFKNIDNTPAHCSNFQHCYLYADGIQLKLDLDVKIQQFKHTRLFQKQDSLNSKYPVILRNGLANYAEFSLGSKITLHSDEDGTFFMRDDYASQSDGKLTGGYCYNGDLVISSDKYLEKFERSINNSNYYPRKYESIFNFNHTDNNIFMERIYRQYVEDFLNNGKYKLYKSPTEGNMIITLTNVSLVPHQQLGRLIADFSSTAYEVADNTIANMKLYNINSLEAKSNHVILANKDPNSKFVIKPGQVRNVFDGKYIKSLTIDEELYLQLLLKDLNPYNYFHKDSISNKYITYQKLPVEIIDIIYKYYTIQKIRNSLIDEIINILSDIDKQVVTETFQKIYSLIIENSDKLPMPEILKNIQLLEDAEEEWQHNLAQAISNKFQTIKEKIISSLGYTQVLEYLINNFITEEQSRYSSVKMLIDYGIYFFEIPEYDLLTYNNNFRTILERAANIKVNYYHYQHESALAYCTDVYLKKTIDFPYDDINNGLYKTNSSIMSIKKQSSYDVEKINNDFFGLKENPVFDQPTNNNLSQDDIIEWIRQQEEIEISEEKKYKLNKVSQIWVELYPKYNIEQEIMNLKAIDQENDTKINRIKRQLQLAKYQLMLEQYELSQSNVITMIIKDADTNEEKEINFLPGRIYQLDNINIKSMYLKYTRPILINYIAELEETDNLPKVSLSKQEIANWGQISGIFTNNKSIIENHAENFNGKDFVVSEDHNYNLYQTLSIMDVVKEKTKKRILKLYELNIEETYNEVEKKIDEFFQQDKYGKYSNEEKVQIINSILKTYYPLSTIQKDSSTDVWINAQGQYIIYHFDGLEALEIEGDENLGFKYSTNRLIEDRYGLIGPTNKISLNRIEKDVIKDAYFTMPSYATVNYKAIASIEKKGVLTSNKEEN